MPEYETLFDSDLAEHEYMLEQQKKEQSCQAEPSVAVGQKVYETDGVRVYEHTVRKVLFETEHVTFDEEAIGSSIFLTPADAAAALAERSSHE
jgi:hypothetical protein